MIKEVKQKSTCYHCGETCDAEVIKVEEKSFCCQGCKTVYGILNEVELCDYYSMNAAPGQSQKQARRPEKFAFLDDETLQQKLIHFKDEQQSHITFYLPQMHCSSCIWLLEHLSRMDKAIVRSQVNFLNKELSVVYNHQQVSLRKVTELLTSVGYEPHFSLNNLVDEKTKTYDKSRIYKIGIGGFCFANIMMLSFPDYFSSGDTGNKNLMVLFSYLSLGLSLPVVFYCAAGFFTSALKSMRQGFLNIDAPIALAVIITFSRSIYEIISGTGSGYLDSMSGIVFFMLLGRFFQDKTYDALSFNRDYTSYFPLSVTIVENDSEKQIPVSDLKPGHRIRIHSQEIIPADCILFLGKAKIDYSFVSGEALPVEKSIGEIIYAGGRQVAGVLDLEVVKEVSQSYLTQLWNNTAFQKDEEKEVSYIHSLSRYFTIVLFSVAAITAMYWYVADVTKMWNAVTAILIVACPCALLLSATFTNGNMLRVLQNFGFYARNAQVIERISDADTLVFDKTGTITSHGESAITYTGDALSDEDLQKIKALAIQSSHPLSRTISNSLCDHQTDAKVIGFKETRGAGIEGFIDGIDVKLGSAEFVSLNRIESSVGTKVYLKMNGELCGCFLIKAPYRSGMERVFAKLKGRYKLSLLSGDTDSERQHLSPFFNADLLFKQSPQDKLNYIESLSLQGKKVIMVGDGLNDAGALKISHVGIAITDDINNFSPACDVIMSGSSFPYFNLLLSYCRQNKVIVNSSFVISILYNIVGLFFAVQGQLQPVIAAILMPVSSLSIVLFTTGMSSFCAVKLRNAQKRDEFLNTKTDINHILN